MKNLMIDLAEGLIFGIVLAIMLHVMGIDVTPAQLGVLAGVSIMLISILNAIGMRLKGQGVANIGETAVDEFAVNRTWTYHYGDNTIEIKNTAKLCELIINGQVQDTFEGRFAFKLSLSGKLPGGQDVTARFATKWTVMVGDEKLSETRR